MSINLNPVLEEDITITTQPGASIPDLKGVTNEIPSGRSANNTVLVHLRTVDQLIVHQKVESMEVLLSHEKRNAYTIKNIMGEPIYSVVEESDCCPRCIFGQMRPLDLKILDHRRLQVIHLHRDLRCQCCFFPCCLQRMEVYSPHNHLIGIIQQEWSILTPKLSIQTTDGETLFTVDGPICTCSCCSDVNFLVHNAINGENIGKIVKKWSGLGRETFTDADDFGITFPMELDVNHKAMLLGALFLVDLMYFEEEGILNRMDDFDCCCCLLKI